MQLLVMKMVRQFAAHHSRFSGKRNRLRHLLATATRAFHRLKFRLAAPAETPL